MITFYPGPSKIYPQVKGFLTEAYDSGILEMNHRSDTFMALLKETILLFKKMQEIPENYEVYFTSSATECWEIVAQSLLHGKVQFAYNGAFGKKWFKYVVTNPAQNKTTPSANESIRGSRFRQEQLLEKVHFSHEIDCFCAVQNETSNGTYIDNYQLSKISGSYLKCYDITSSLGGQKINFDLGDVWLGSVQKCLGLPSGLGVLIASPKAITTAEKINERNHYNSLLFIKENFKKYQTHYTPNVLNIFLLNRVLKSIEAIPVISKKLENRASDFYDFINGFKQFKPLIKNPETRSSTIFAIEAEEKIIPIVKNKAQENGIILGNGYGEWKNTTFRVANFPAIPDSDFDQLKHYLSSNFE